MGPERAHWLAATSAPSSGSARAGAADHRQRQCAITRACARDPEVQRPTPSAEGYGFRIDACPPRDPQKKGIVEAG